MPDEIRNIRERLIRHIAQLAPHIKARESGQLLVDALAEIDRLRVYERQSNDTVKD